MGILYFAKSLHLDKMYFLGRSTDISIIGSKYPQLEKMFDGFYADYWYEAFGIKSPRRQTPMEQVSGFRLYYHAKVTDWISGASICNDMSLLSDKFYHLLQEYRCMDAVSIDSLVEHHKKTYPYKFNYYPNVYENAIDFKRSIFYIKYWDGKMEDIEFDNYEEYRKLKDEFWVYNQNAPAEQTRLIKCSTLYFDETACELDFFRLGALVSPRFVVTPALKEAMEAAGITGIRFEPAQGHKFT
jgi:hypothetical protein